MTNNTDIRSKLQLNRIQKNIPIVVVDGIFFQISTKSGIARVWRSLLTEWVKSGFAKHLLVLDRDSTAPKITGINYQLIHRYQWDSAIEDSFKLQEICDRYQADLFISTYYTTPISTPGIFLVHDMIPEVVGEDLTMPIFREKIAAVYYATQYISISDNTALDLRKFYPQIDPQTITVAYNGVDPLFTPSSLTEISQFLSTHQITLPYFLIFGDRVAGGGYKNALHSFRAISKLGDLNIKNQILNQQFEIICLGGSSELEPELAMLTKDIKVHQLSLSDRELQAAYSGAIALVYPSIYEGFGLPILEAMACGCPVITCRNSALPEVAGSAAIYVSETEVAELVDALNRVQQPDLRSQLIAAGLAQAKHFSWTKMAETIAEVILNTHRDIQSGRLHRSPTLPWAQFRQNQQQLASSQLQLADTQARLITVQQQIISMESSKFWQLRQLWFKLKKWLKLVSD